MAVAFGLRFWQLGRVGLGVEEAAAWYFAGRPIDEIVTLALASHQSPLIPFLVDLWRQFAGSSEFALRWPALAAGVLVVPVTYQLARRAIEMLRVRRDYGGGVDPIALSRQPIALVSAFLLASAAPLVAISQSAAAPGFVGLAAPLAAYLLLRALGASGTGRESVSWWSAVVLVSVAGLYLHPDFGGILAGLGVFSLVWLGAGPAFGWISRRDVRAGVIGLGVSAAAIVVLFLPWIFWAGRDPGGAPLSVTSLLTLTPGWLIVLTVVLFAVGLVHLLRLGDRASGLPMGVFLVAGIAAPLGWAVAGGVEDAMVATATLPLILIGVASGPGLLFGLAVQRSPAQDSRTPSLLFGMILLSALLIGSGVGLGRVYGSLVSGQRTIRNVAARIANDGDRRDAVVVVSGLAEFAFRYYLPGRTIMGVPPAAESRGPGPPVSGAAELLNLLAGSHESVWLVRWRPASGDPADIVYRQLRTQREALTDRYVYGDVSVQRYALGGAPFMPDAETATRIDGSFGGSVRLAGYSVYPEAAEAGDVVEMVLIWSAGEGSEAELETTVRLINEAGLEYATVRRPAGYESYRTADWAKGRPVVDRYEIPLDPGTPPGRYSLHVGLGVPGEFGESVPVAELEVTASDLTADLFVPPIRRGRNFGELRFVGYELPSEAAGPGKSLRIVAWWTAPGVPSVDYSLAYRLIDPNGEELRAVLNRGAGNAFATSNWKPNQIVMDVAMLLLPEDFPAGTYTLQIGVQIEGSGVGVAPWSTVTKIEVK